MVSSCLSQGEEFSYPPFSSPSSMVGLARDDSSCSNAESLSDAPYACNDASAAMWLSSSMPRGQSDSVLARFSDEEALLHHQLQFMQDAQSASEPFLLQYPELHCEPGQRDAKRQQFHESSGQSMPELNKQLAHELLHHSRSDSILVDAAPQQLMMKDTANGFGSAPVLPTVPKARYGIPDRPKPRSLSEAIMMGYPGILGGPWPGANWGCDEDDWCCVPRSISEYLERCRFLRSHSEGLLLPRELPKQAFPRAFSCGLVGGNLRRAVEELHDALEEGTISRRPLPPRRIPVKELVVDSPTEGKVVRVTGMGLFLDIGATREGLLWRRDLKGIPFKIEKGEVIAGLIIKKINKKKGQITLAWRCTHQDTTIESTDLEEIRNHIANWAGVDLNAKRISPSHGHSAGTLTREPSGEFSDGGSSASSSRSGSMSPCDLDQGLGTLNAGPTPKNPTRVRGSAGLSSKKAPGLPAGRGRRRQAAGGFGKGLGGPALLGRAIPPTQTRIDGHEDKGIGKGKNKGKSLLRA